MNGIERFMLGMVFGDYLVRIWKNWPRKDSHES